MNEQRLNQLLAQGRKSQDAVERNLQLAYEQAYDQALVEIRENFKSSSVLVASDWSPPPDDPTDLQDLTPLLALLSAPLIHALAALLAPLETELDLTPEEWAPISDLLRSIAEQTVATIPTGLREPVANAIAASQELSFEAAVEAVDTAVSEATVSQSAALARTAASAVANGGSLLSVEVLNARSAENDEPQFSLKRWTTVHDERVRSTHVAASGQEVPIKSAFTVGGFNLRFPCDPDGPIAETWSCRCYLTFHEQQTVVASPQPTLLSEAIMSPAYGIYEITSGSVVDMTGTTKFMWPTQMAPVISPDLNAAVTVTVDEAVQEEVSAPVAWEGVLAVENVVTADGRIFMADSFTHRDLPLTLLAQVVTADGHDGAEVCGRIDMTWRRDAPEFGEGAVAIMGSGVFDAGEFGQQTARMVGDQVLRGVSVDLARYEVVLLDAETMEEVPEDQVDFEKLLVGGYVMGFTLAEMGAATICALPAFEDASIAVLATSSGVLVASNYGLTTESLVASVAPLKPPREWFELPEPDDLIPMTYTNDGQVYGHAATWECHAGYVDRCVLAPHSRYNLAYFHIGEIETAEGDLIPIGKITVRGGHADNNLSRASAMAHYDDCTTVGAFVKAVEGKHGVWVCGAVKSDLSPEALRDLRANPPSGDWRAGELIALHSVVVPGLPVLRTEARVVVASDGQMEVATLITPPVTTEDCGCGMDEQEYQIRIEALADLAGV